MKAHSLLFLVAVSFGCSPESPAISEFESTDKTISYFINFNDMKYDIVSKDGSQQIGNIISNCSNKSTYCMSGPFHLSIPRHELRKMISSPGYYVILSSNKDVDCQFKISTLGNLKGFIIIQFHCVYKNGMPWPTFHLKQGLAGNMSSEFRGHYID